MERIEKYLNALSVCKITGRTQKELRLNGYCHTEYEKVMNEMYEAFRVALLSGSYSLQDFISITKKIEEAKKQVVRFKKIVERTGTDNDLFRPLYALFGCYRRQVEKTAELVESVNIMKLAQAPFVPQVVPAVKEVAPEVKPSAENEVPEDTTPEPTTEKMERRSFNDKNTSHPGEYWGFKEMEEGEGIAHSTACKISKDPDLQPAFRYVGRAIRVDIAKLHELQRKKTAEKNKPIGNNPRKHKKTPTL